MNKGQFEILSADSALIHGRTFKVHSQDEPFEDGTIHTLESTSDSRNQYCQFLEVNELRGVSAAKLPLGFSIMVEQPKSEFKNTTLTYFKRVPTGYEVSQSIFFDYTDWHLPINVFDFADLLKIELTEGPSKLLRVDIDKSDASVYLICYAAMNRSDDIYLKYRELDASILRAYRKCIKSIVAPSSTENTRLKDDSSGVRWWIRYVVVPVVGSGAFAALIAWLISKGFLV